MIYDSTATAAATRWRLHLSFFTRGWGAIAEVQLCWFLEVYWNDNDFFIYCKSLLLFAYLVILHAKGSYRQDCVKFKDFPTVSKN